MKKTQVSKRIPMKDKKFDFLEHTADIKIRIYGRTLEEVFENSVLAVSEFLSRGKKIKSREKKKIRINGKDLEFLFYGFLDELIYLFDADNFISAKANVKIEKGVLTAEILGDRASEYKDLDQIKAATYSEMYVRRTGDNNWEAQAVLDV